MRDRDAQQHRAARSALTPEEQASQREQNTLLRQELRHERTADEIDEERGRDRLQHEAGRAARDEEARESAKEAARIRKKCVRHGHALENHENFDKSKVSGNNVEDGRHTPPTSLSAFGAVPGNGLASRKFPVVSKARFGSPRCSARRIICSSTLTTRFLGDTSAPTTKSSRLHRSESLATPVVGFVECERIHRFRASVGSTRTGSKVLWAIFGDR
jgi:hypothetical protein